MSVSFTYTKIFYILKVFIQDTVWIIQNLIYAAFGKYLFWTSTVFSDPRLPTKLKNNLYPVCISSYVIPSDKYLDHVFLANLLVNSHKIYKTKEGFSSYIFKNQNIFAWKYKWAEIV